MAGVERTPAVEQLRQTIDRQSEFLSEILDDLLDVNCIEHGSFSVQLQPLQLNDVLSSAVEAGRPLIEACSHSLHTDWPAGPIYVLGDRTRLTQVFINLLTNASKYTTAGGQISLRMEADGAKTTVCVKDTGSGIPPQLLESIFNPFTRGESSDGSTKRGLGLGLAIGRRIIEMHHGTLQARSDGVGLGSEFVVTLPLAKEGLRSEVHGSGPASARIARILAVSENLELAKNVVGLLEARGHNAQIASDAAAALSVSQTFRPDIVLVDMDAAGPGGGYELAGRLREQQRDAQPMLVALTDWAHESDQQRALDAGFKRYLLKPITREALDDVLAALTSVATRDTPSA
jgi:CheY-like chemotaxis protein